MTDSPHPQAKVLTVLNLKGGVGKTHAVWLLAAVCHEQGRRALCVDLDTQANLTSSFIDEPDGRPGVEMLFHPGADRTILPLIRQTAYDFIDIVPSTPQLARFDLSNQKDWEKADSHLALVDPIRTLRDQYDFILFDCPPRLSLVSVAALCASDAVIIPLEAADWGAQGITQVAAIIRSVQTRYNAELQLLGYLISRFKATRTYQQTYVKLLGQEFGSQAFDTVIPDLAQFEKSVTDRIPITLHARRSSAAGIARTFFAEVERRYESLCRSRRSQGQAHLRQKAGAAA